MSTLLQESFKETVSRLAKRFKFEVNAIHDSIAENENKISSLPSELQGQVDTFEKLMDYKIKHLHKKVDRLDGRLQKLQQSLSPRGDSSGKTAPSS